MNQQNQTIITQGVTLEELLSQVRHIVHSELNTLPKPEKVKTYLNVDELSELSGLTKRTIYQRTSDKQIPHRKVGNKLLFNRAEIIQWLESNAPEIGR